MRNVHLKAVPNSVADIPFQAASMDIWDKKYRLKSRDGVIMDQDIEGTYQRIAKSLADIETTPFSLSRCRSFRMAPSTRRCVGNALSDITMRSRRNRHSMCVWIGLMTRMPKRVDEKPCRGPER